MAGLALLDMRLGNDLRELTLRNAWKSAADAAGWSLRDKHAWNDRMCAGNRANMLRLMLATCANGHGADMLCHALANPMALWA